MHTCMCGNIQDGWHQYAWNNIFFKIRPVFLHTPTLHSELLPIASLLSVKERLGVKLFCNTFSTKHAAQWTAIDISPLADIRGKVGGGNPLIGLFHRACWTWSCYPQQSFFHWRQVAGWWWKSSIMCLTQQLLSKDYTYSAKWANR